MSSDTPKLDKLFDMVSEREGPCETGDAPSKWSYEAILDLTDFARTLERENAALQAEVSRLTENQRLQDSATAAVMERAEKLTARVAELERDAGRYRWLRDQNWTQRGLFVVSANNQDVVRLGTNCPSGELLDAAIDAGRRTE